MKKQSKQNIFTKSVLAAVLATMALPMPSFAAIEQEALIVNEFAKRVRRGQDQTDAVIFLGLESGYAGLTNVPANEREKGGFNFNAKLMFSLYFQPMILDLGGGWNYNYVSGSSTTGNVTTTADVRTRAGFFEVNPRFWLGDNWQLGPLVQVEFGTDLSFAEVLPNNQDVVTFLGLAFLYEFNEDKLPLRLGAKYMTDLNIPGDRQLHVGLITFQIGIPLTNRPTITVVEQLPKPEPIHTVNLDESLIHFKSNSAELEPRSKQFLKELAKNLSATDQPWNNLQIGGHTDDRGTFDYNLKLSLNRAEEVKKALIEGGADPRKIETLGYSLSRPIDPSKTKEARSKNRRVELKFNGVVKPEVINGAIENAKRTTAFQEVPQTP